jgi:hypothetical protein
MSRARSLPLVEARDRAWSPWARAMATNPALPLGGVRRVRKSRSQARLTFSSDRHASLFATTVGRSAFCSSLIAPPVLGVRLFRSVWPWMRVDAHVHGLRLLVHPRRARRRRRARDRRRGSPR